MQERIEALNDEGIGTINLETGQAHPKDNPETQNLGRFTADVATAAMKASMDGIAIIDHGGVCTYLNDAYAKIFGYAEPERLIGASWEMFSSTTSWSVLKNSARTGLICPS